MARAIKSILANRKLFQSGGLVPPGNPNQANGILASSQPLIDSVVSDAVNPQGGGTLSMNQGGIAKFEDGGVFSAHRPGIGMGVGKWGRSNISGSGALGTIAPDISSVGNRPHFMYEDSQDPDIHYQMSVGDLAKKGEAYKQLFPYGAEEEAKVSRLLEGVDLKGISPLEFGAKNLYAIIHNMVAGFSQITRQGAKALESGAQWLVQKQDDDHLSFEKLVELNTMLYRQPEHAEDIMEISNTIMSSERGQNMNAEQYKNAVAEGVFNRARKTTAGLQAVPQEGDVRKWAPEDWRVPGDPRALDPSLVESIMASNEGMTLEEARDRVAAISVEGAPYLPNTAEQVMAETDPITQRETRLALLGQEGAISPDDLSGYQAVMGDPAAQQAFIQDLTATKGDEYVAALLAQIQEVGEPLDAGEPPAAIPVPEITVTGSVEPENVQSPAPFGPDPARDIARQTQEEISGENPEVATQTNPRSDGSAVAKNMEVPDEAKLTAVMKQDVHLVDVPSSAGGDPQTVTRDTIYGALRTDGGDSDEDLQIAGLNDLLTRIANMGAEDPATANVPTMEELKKDIEAALPVVEDDKSMAGLHTILLGAAIAGGTSSNPWTNIAQGVAQQLPAIIAYKGKLAEAKRSRQMTIAKLAIEQKLGLEAEGRAEARGIRKEGRVEGRAIAKERRAEALALRTPVNYMYVKDTLVPATTFDKNADKDKKVLIPQWTMLPLTPDELDRAVDAGLTKNLILHKNVNAKDMAPVGTEMDSTDYKNELHPPTKMTIFKDYYPGGDGLTYFIQAPTGWGQKRGRTKYAILKGDIDKINNGFNTASGKLGVIYDDLRNLGQYAESGELTGLEAMRGRSGDYIAAWKGQGIPFMDELSAFLLRGEDQSKVSMFEAEGRLVLAKITPMLLGESGRTISDADRIRVARALGYTIDTDVNTGAQTIKLLGPGALQSAAQIQHALNVVSDVINDSYINIAKEYRDHMSGLEYIIPKAMSASLEGPGTLPMYDFDATT